MKQKSNFFAYYYEALNFTRQKYRADNLRFTKLIIILKGS